VSNVHVIHKTGLLDVTVSSQGRNSNVADFGGFNDKETRAGFSGAGLLLLD